MNDVSEADKFPPWGEVSVNQKKISVDNFLLASDLIELTSNHYILWLNSSLPSIVKHLGDNFNAANRKKVCKMWALRPISDLSEN